MLLAEKFGMYYVDTDGEKKLPYIIHRTSLGCYERTLAYLLEEYAGAFPTWLAPVQVKVLSISEKFLPYAKEVENKLKDAGIRVENDERNEKIGYKLRQSITEKVPYAIIIGEKEEQDGTVSVRNRGSKDTRVMSVDELVKEILDKVQTKVRD